MRLALSISSRLFFLTLSALALVSCATTSLSPVGELGGVSGDIAARVVKEAGTSDLPAITVDRDDLLHIVQTDSSGYYIDPTGRFLDPEIDRDDLSMLPVRRRALDEQLDLLGQRMVEDRSYTRLVMFIHGGLVSMKNSRIGAIQKMAGVKEYNRKNSSAKIFPVFLTWNSALGTSYWQKATTEQGGISYRFAGNRNFMHIGTVPRLAADAAVGVARMPGNVISGAGVFADTFDGMYRRHPEWFPLKRTYLWQLTGLEGAHPLGQSGASFDRSTEAGIVSQVLRGVHAKTSDGTVYSLGTAPSKEDYGLIASNVAYSPLKTASSVLHDWIAAPAWHNMTRRTKTLVRPFDDFLAYEDPTRAPESAPALDREATPNGVASVLFDRIARTSKHHPGVTFELYGHSMGAMVVNEMLREVNEGRVRDPGIDRLVYMAAACSIVDFTATGGRYLDEHPDCDFYNLCLHPESELKEVISKKVNPAISGSLLVWIDNYYQSPEAFLDRTLGSFSNVIVARRYLPSGSRMHYKGFGHGFGRDRERYGPQKHGALDDFYFWESDYLDPRTTPEQGSGYAALKLPEVEVARWASRL